MATEKMPKWPNKPAGLTFTSSPDGLTSRTVAYERARAEAAIARLKVAVEALKSIASDSPDVNDEWRRAMAFDAVVSIGEIPE